MTDQPPDIEHRRWIFEQQRRDAERAHDKSDEFFHKLLEAAITAANLALRMSLLLNGGAAISVLTFIRSLPTDKKPLVAGGLVWFAWGAASAVAGIALAYATNYCMAGVAASRERIWQSPYLRETRRSKLMATLNKGFHVAAVIVGTASLVLFISGMFAVKSAISHLV